VGFKCALHILWVLTARQWIPASESLQLSDASRPSTELDFLPQESRVAGKAVPFLGLYSRTTPQDSEGN
jgi:hypothetical protein